jgi:hypothetical protein
MLADLAMFLTHPKCDTAAREWFLREFEKVRSTIKAQIREQNESVQLGHLFGPKTVEASTPPAPTAQVRRGRGRPRKAETPQVGLEPLRELFKPAAMSPECQRQLDALFNRRPTPTRETNSSAGN